MSSRGAGVGFSDDGRRWFVPNTVPGDHVEIAVRVDPRGRESAELLRLLQPGPARVEPSCPQAEHCPGCQLQFLSPEAQRHHKHAAWHAVLARAISPDIRVHPVVPAQVHSGYRSRAVAHALRAPDGRLILGMKRRRRVPGVIELSECPTQNEQSRALLGMLSRTLHDWGVKTWRESSEGLRYVVVETADLESTGEPSSARAALLFSKARPALESRLKEAFQDTTLGLSVGLGVCPPESFDVELQEVSWVIGRGVIAPRVLEGHLHVSPGSWYSNAPRNAHIVRTLLMQAVDAHCKQHQGLSAVVEMGCGVGTHAFALAARARVSYIGIDRERTAIDDAQENLRRLGSATPMSFRVGRDERALRQLLKKGNRADLAVLHSMRKPFSPRLGMLLRALGTRTVVVVAPSVRALTGNLEHLAPHGFEVQDVRPVDTMPLTAHMMAIAVCRRL